jgi:hypothetical protein
VDDGCGSDSRLSVVKVESSAHCISVRCLRYPWLDQRATEESGQQWGDARLMAVQGSQSFGFISYWLVWRRVAGGQGCRGGPFPQVVQRRISVVAAVDCEHNTRGVTTMNWPTRPRYQDQEANCPRH